MVEVNNYYYFKSNCFGSSVSSIILKISGDKNLGDKKKFSSFNFCTLISDFPRFSREKIKNLFSTINVKKKNTSKTK